MASDELVSIGAFSSQEETNFARRALIEIGRFDGSLISIVVDTNENSQTDRYCVVLNDTSASVTQAKTFLKGAMPQMRVEQDLRHEAKQSAERVKGMPFMGGMSL